MTRSAQSISVRELQSAVQSALDATRKKHPEFKIDQAVAGAPRAFIYRPWTVCGIPPVLPWEGYDLNKAAEFTATFASNLASNPALAPLAVDGKFEPALYVAGGKVSLGFVPGEADITE